MTPTKGIIMSEDKGTGPIRTTKISYDGEDRTAIVLTFPCGCENKIRPEYANVLGTPFQYKSYCDDHFHE